MACMEGYIITLITFLHFPFKNASSRCLHKWTKNCVNYNSFDFLRCGFSKVSPWHFYQSTKSHTNCICLAFVQCSMTPVTPETPRLPRLRDSRGFCHITFQFSFISDLPLFQIFQILQILKWKWKWKDPTFAIFLKNMGFKDVEYNIPETLRLPRLPRLWDSETLRQKEDKTTKCKNAGPPSTIIEHC